MTTITEVSAEDFAFIREFIHREAAISLEDGKEYLVRSRLSPLVRAHRLDGLGDLVATLRRRPSSALGTDVVDALTTNETSFFRDTHPFESLRDHILPELLAARASSRRLRIWCAAASSGQEPWSIAIILREHFPWLAAWDVSIEATDISRGILARAEAAIYSQREVDRGLPPEVRDRHMHRVGDRWQVNDDVRSMVTFTRLNLSEPFPPGPVHDLVFLRNVLIYFDAETKASILARTRRRLADDGFLILGGAETVPISSVSFDRTIIGRSVWYRAA